MIETIEYKGLRYPKFQSEGNAMQFAMPFAKHLCKGIGYDIGYNREEWKFLGAIGIDSGVDPTQDAMNLPEGEVDYIISSHCLEHLPRWDEALLHWTSRLKQQGVLFLYLPHSSQKYWKVGNNKKHIHNLDGQDITEFLHEHCGMTNILVTESDLNCSFYVVAEKC